ncbi:MAG: hypothetical protein H0T43_04215 [Solirubrobacterales bacterium]|nr:hypothetical protein [Solirubrobacterales bacterium]
MFVSILGLVGDPATTAETLTQIKTVARENPLPVAAFGAFVAGVVIGRLSAR